MLKSEKTRQLAPEMDPLRRGMGWKISDLSKPQIMVESSYGDSHPGSVHLNIFVEESLRAVDENGGKASRYFATDMCDGIAQGHDGINYSLITDGRFSGASRGPVIGHVSPEAAAGGPIALVEEGDIIELDVPNRSIQITGVKGENKTPEEMDAILAERKTNWNGFESKYKRGLLKLYAEHAVSSMKSAYME